MTAGVSNGQHSPFEQMHGSFLFIAISLISKIVKCQDRVFRREHGSHQSCPIEFVLIRTFFDVVNECLGSCEHPFPAQVALNRHDSSKAIQALQETTPYEFGAVALLYPAYIRGNAYLAAHQP